MGIFGTRTFPGLMGMLLQVSGSTPVRAHKSADSNLAISGGVVRSAAPGAGSNPAVRSNADLVEVGRHAIA